VESANTRVGRMKKTPTGLKEAVNSKQAPKERTLKNMPSVPASLDSGGSNKNLRGIKAKALVPRMHPRTQANSPDANSSNRLLKKMSVPMSKAH
jgi:hypothetical protein